MSWVHYGRRILFGLVKGPNTRGAQLAAPLLRQLLISLRYYDSFSTVTLIWAVTSRNTLMVTGNSPMVLSGSANCAWRLSLLDPSAPSASALAPDLSEPNI